MKIFDYLNDITYKKENIMASGDEYIENSYAPYRMNKFLSQHIDCMLYANEMNFHSHLDNKLQFDYFINSIRKKFRRSEKWLKPEDFEVIDLVKEYYGYSTPKAKEALRILGDDDIEYIRKKLYKGGSSHDRNNDRSGTRPAR